MAKELMIFILNGDKELEINKYEAKKIPEFKVLFNRATPLISDPTGSKGHLACAELYYIYIVYDIRSLYFNLDIEERKIKARSEAGLPPQWKEDKDLANAVKAYQEVFKLNSSGKGYTSAERSYYMLADDTDLILDEMTELKAMLRKRSAVTRRQRIGDQELMTAANEYATIVSALAKAQKEVMDNVARFGKLGDSVKELAQKFIESGGNLRTPVGGGELGRREE